MLMTGGNNTAHIDGAVWCPSAGEVDRLDDGALRSTCVDDLGSIDGQPGGEPAKHMVGEGDIRDRFC